MDKLRFLSFLIILGVVADLNSSAEACGICRDRGIKCGGLIYGVDSCRETPPPCDRRCDYRCDTGPEHQRCVGWYFYCETYPNDICSLYVRWMCVASFSLGVCRCDENAIVEQLPLSQACRWQSCSWWW